MPIVVGKKHRWRIIAAHVGLIAFILLLMFPLLAIISISFRPGTFATGSLIPSEISLEHWKLALGFSYQAADGSLVEPPFPVLRWLWNSIKIAAASSFLLVAIFAIFETIGTFIPWLGVETHAGVILAYLGGVALHIWTIRGYFDTIPV